MSRGKTNKVNRITKMVASGLMLFMLSSFMPQKVYATELQNTEEQYMQLKVASVQNIPDGDKQVILEWWSYNLQFKGLDLRFSYDNTKLEPSSIEDNSYVTDESNFEFTNDFTSYMRYRVLQAENGTYRCYMSLNNYDTSGKYIEKDDDDNYYVNTVLPANSEEKGVLLGRMSFRLFEGELNEETFSLQPSTTSSPTTGIKISKNYLDSYENTEEPSVFRFTVLSSDADLKEIKYSFFNYIEENDTKTMPTIKDNDYTSINLTKVEEGSTEILSKYKLTLNENLENISLKMQTSNEHAKVKIYNQEIDLSKTKEITLNALGEEDTVIEIIVTAQNGSNTHTYEITVHRPFATIKGNIKYDVIEENENPDIDKTTMLNIYKTGDFNWNKLKDLYASDALTYDDLDEIEKEYEYKSKADGTYEIYVIPGKYDLQIDKRGFLDYIITDIDLNENDEVNLGTKTIIAGDVNRDGVVGLEDIQEVLNRMDVEKGDLEYDEQYDFVQYEVIGLESLQYTVVNTDEMITIEKK